MNRVRFWPGKPRRVHRPLSLDELHRHARTAVAKLTDSTSLASPVLAVVDIPVNADGRAVSGHFRVVSPDAAMGGRDLHRWRRRVFWLGLALGRKRYRSCQITIGSPAAKALSVLFAKEGPVRVGDPLIQALGTLIHEEFHAVHYVGFQGLVQDMVLATPGIQQAAEGIVELGVEDLFLSILSQIGLGGLKVAAPFLQTRRVYVAQKEAVRGLLNHMAVLLRKPPGEVLKRALGYGSGMIAVRTLAHDIARAHALPDRVPEWQWVLARFQTELPPGAESRISREVVAPLEELAEWYRSSGDVFGDAASNQGLQASNAAIRGLDDCLRRAA